MDVYRVKRTFINESHHIFSFPIPAGKTTTNEELEEMLEQGNSAVFTQGVRVSTMNKNLFLISTQHRTMFAFARI
jgi:hypothetical protein